MAGSEEQEQREAEHALQLFDSTKQQGKTTEKQHDKMLQLCRRWDGLNVELPYRMMGVLS